MSMLNQLYAENPCVCLPRVCARVPISLLSFSVLERVCQGVTHVLLFFSKSVTDNGLSHYILVEAECLQIYLNLKV